MICDFVVVVVVVTSHNNAKQIVLQYFQLIFFLHLQRWTGYSGEHLGWHALCHFLFPDYIGACIPQWTIHTATSSRLANYFRSFRSLFAVHHFPNVSKLQSHHGNILLVWSKPAYVQHRHGQSMHLNDSISTHLHNQNLIQMILYFKKKNM